jgi:transposase
LTNRITITPHLTLQQLKTRYRTATAVIERNHYQIIWLLAKGKTTEEVAEISGYSRDRIYKLVRKYNNKGQESLGDQRQNCRGAKPLLNDEQLARLAQALQEEPPSGGWWNGPKVAAWMSEHLERPIHPQRGWEYLRGLEMRLRRPRPIHIQRREGQEQEWKKNCTA